MIKSGVHATIGLGIDDGTGYREVKVCVVYICIMDVRVHGRRVAVDVIITVSLTGKREPMGGITGGGSTQTGR